MRAQGAPIVVKADGLAAGKGVVVAQTVAEAEAAIDMMFGGGLGEAGAEVVIEEFLEGEEASFFALCDGETAIPLVSAQDHKRVFDGDKGPNTGGMGAYSPVPVMTADMERRAMDEFVLPTVAAMKEMGMPFTGVLYLGLMITASGPKLIEYNVRFGDPECQVLMLRLMSDIVPALLASAEGQLRNFDLRWFPDTALTVVMAANGYPGSYGKGSVIDGLDAAAAVEGVEIFHAGTAEQGGRIVANGGRVLNVCALGRQRGGGAGARLCRRRLASAGRKDSAAATSAGARSRGSGRARQSLHHDEIARDCARRRRCARHCAYRGARSARRDGRAADRHRRHLGRRHDRRGLCRRHVGPRHPPPRHRARAQSQRGLPPADGGARRQFREPVLGRFRQRDAGRRREILRAVSCRTRCRRISASLQIPLLVIASDLYRRQQVVLSSGSLRRAVAASMALPTLVRPISIDDKVLVDGGATNPLPFDQLRGRADVIVAVDISGEPNDVRRDIPTPWEAILATILVMGQAITTEKLKHGAPDLIIRPNVGLFRTLDFFQASAILRVCETGQGGDQAAADGAAGELTLCVGEMTSARRSAWDPRARCC